MDMDMDMGMNAGNSSNSLYLSFIVFDNDWGQGDEGTVL